MNKLRMNLATVCVAVVMMFSGCISLERTRDQLASGDPEQVKLAKDNIVYVAAEGGGWNGQQHKFSTKERLEFLNLATDDELRLKVAKGADDSAVQLAALEKIDITKPGKAKYVMEEFAKTFEDHLGDRDESVSDLLGNNSGKKENRWKVLASKYVGAMNENEMLALLGKTDKDHCTLLKRFVSQRLANTAQSPKVLVMYLTGSVSPQLRESLQKRLLPKINELTVAQVEKMLFYGYGDSHLKYITDRKLAEQLVKRLPDTSKGEETSKEKFAFEAVKDMAIKGFPQEQCDKLDLAIVAAANTKDKAIATKIADAFFKEIVEHKRRCDDNDWMLIKHTWNDKKEKTAAYYMSQLVEIAGEKWFASALPKVGLKKFDFIAKQITPAVAAMAFESEKIENGYMEDELAKQLPTEKITAKIYDSLTSGLAKKTLAAKMPQTLKDKLAAANEKAVERILSEAKAKEGETFVLGGFYVGMPIDDATILLRHYAGQEKAVDLNMNDKNMPELWLGGQKQYFAIGYSDTRNVRTFNFGPWILRKFCNYNAQNGAEWGLKFMEDKKLNMTLKTIGGEADTIYVDLLNEDHTVALAQNTWQHKDGAKKFRLIYFGEQHLETDSTDNIANMAIRDRALKYYSSISAPEGFLRLEIYKE